MSRLAETFHPGVFLEEELEARGWTRSDLGNILGRAANDISLIITGKRGITPETAIGLGDAFGTGAEYWMNLETAYQLSVARAKGDGVALKGRLYKKFPVREMLKRGWVEATTDVNALIGRFCDFFEIPSLESPVQFDHAALKSTEYEESTPLQVAWLFRARQLARKSMLSSRYTLAKLRACKAKLRQVMHETEELRKVPVILSEAGIRFVVVEFLPGGKMDGATFWLDEDSPVIAMSLLKDRIDSFWFVLLHELDHVEHGEGYDNPIVDMDLCEPTTASEVPDYELRASQNAAQFLIDQTELTNFIVRTDPYYHQNKIEGFAYLHKIHPGIVVGQLQKRGHVRWNQHRKLLDKVRGIVAEASLTDGYGFEVR